MADALSSLSMAMFDAALAELDVIERKKKYREDPVLWAKDILGVELWSKQREIAYSVRDNRNTAVAAGHAVGKLLSQDEWHPTPTGWVQTRDIRVGTHLFDERGAVTRVTGLSPWWDQEMFRITFDDGCTIEAGENHEWSVLDLTLRRQSNGTKSGVKDWRDRWDTAVIKTTREMFNNLRTSGNQIRWRIPLAGALQMPEADLPIDPYLLGFWLGDGTTVSGQITIGSTKMPLLEWLEENGYEYRCNDLGREAEGWSLRVEGLHASLRDAGLLGHKHIPMQYLRASEAQRRALLAGLMDSDGFLAAPGVPSVGLDTTNLRMATDLMELLRTLGCTPRMSEGKAAYTKDGVRHTTGIRYRINWRPLENPFRIRGAEWVDNDAHRSRSTCRSIVSIDPIGRGRSRCIEVDSPSHLYLAGDGMIPTHNSFLASILMCWWIDVHPIDQTRVLSTAPTYDQVSGILWNEARRWWATAKRRYDEHLRRRQLGLPLGEYQFNDHPLPGRINANDEWLADDGRQLGIGRKPPDNLLDSALQGIHAPFLLVIGDEGAGLPAELVDALGNNATGSENRQLIIANPTDPSSRMADFWKKNNPDWVRFNISVFDSPPITGEEFPFGEADGMSGWDYINEKRRDWGEDDPRYISRVLGQWAYDSGLTVLTEEEIVKAMNTVVIPDENARPRDGWDIARSEKGDSTVGYRSVEGEVWKTDEFGNPTEPTGRRGVRVRRIDDWKGAPLVGSNPENPGSATRIDKHALGAGSQLVIIDATGLGGGVVDGLRDLGFGKQRYAVMEYFGSAASTDSRAYLNARAEHYFALKKLAFSESLDLDPKDESLIEELRGITYEYTIRGQIKISAKDEIRKKMSGASPDRADAVVYATADVSPLNDPLQRLNKGDHIFADPWEMLQMSRTGPGMPL